MNFGPGSFLGRLSGEDLATLETIGRRTRHPKDATLFLEGESPSRVFMLLSGKVKIHSASPHGRSVVLGVRGPGDIIGELSAIDGNPRVASAITLEAVEALVVAPAEFQSFLEGRPGVASALLRILAQRIREADANRTHFGSGDCATRIALLLLELAERHGSTDGNGSHIDLALTQQDLADWVGESREAVTKALHSLREAGLIETSRRRITILDSRKLAARVD